MTRKKAYQLVLSLLLALIAGLLIAGVVRLYLEGAAARAAGDLFYPVFTREKMAALFSSLLPLAAVAAGFPLAGAVLGIRDEEAERPAQCRPAAGAPQRPGRRLRLLRLSLLLLSVLLIAAGVRNGGLEDVLTKASAICMECIGIG